MNDSERKPAQSVTASGTQFEPLLDSDEAGCGPCVEESWDGFSAGPLQIAAIQIGKLWRFRASVLDEWLNTKAAV